MAFVVGARPQFVKAAAVYRFLGEHPEAPGFNDALVHSGQHYDELVNDVFFRELPLPAPAAELGVGDVPLEQQFGRIVERITPVYRRIEPDAVVVFGDTTTTIGAALAAAYLDVPVVHVEAGERSYRRRRFPEELNRIVVDHASTLCLTATEGARDQLLTEGVSPARVRFVGDVMLDLFLWAWPRLAELAKSETRPDGPYDLATLHRAENTDDAARLRTIIAALDRGPRPVILPAHPRLATRLAAAGIEPQGAIRMVPPVGYFQLLRLLEGATLVVTDSGGVMREASFAGKPCVVPMRDMPWRVLVDEGWAHEVDADADELAHLLRNPPSVPSQPTAAFGDGKACARIVASLNELVGGPLQDPAIWRAPSPSSGAEVDDVDLLGALRPHT